MNTEKLKCSWNSKLWSRSYKRKQDQ